MVMAKTGFGIKFISEMLFNSRVYTWISTAGTYTECSTLPGLIEPSCQFQTIEWFSIVECHKIKAKVITQSG